MSAHIKPLKNQMTPEDRKRASDLFLMVHVLADQLDFMLADLSEVLSKYKMGHAKAHTLRKLAADSRAFSAENSRTIGERIAVRMGDVSDQIGVILRAAIQNAVDKNRKNN